MDVVTVPMVVILIVNIAKMSTKHRARVIEENVAILIVLIPIKRWKKGNIAVRKLKVFLDLSFEKTVTAESRKLLPIEHLK